MLHGLGHSHEYSDRGGFMREGIIRGMKNPLRVAQCVKVALMATCRECKNEVDKLVTVKVSGKAKKLCEDCADRLREAGEIAEASEGVIQGMMGFKGRR